MLAGELSSQRQSWVVRAGQHQELEPQLCNSVVHAGRTSLRKLPRQVDTAKGDCTGVLGLGRNMRGGTRPRLSCGRSWL